MKKTLLTICSVVSMVTAFAQIPSPSWTITQNAAFPMPSAGVKFLDAVDASTVWLTGYDGSAASQNLNYWSLTTDGGTTYTSGVIWQSTVTPLVGDTDTYRLANLEGVDGCNAWVSAYMKATDSKGAIFKTVNGGGSWVNMTSAAMFTNVAAFTDFVSFLTPSVGIALGDPVAGEFEIWRSTDAGTTWSAIPGASIPNPLAGEYGLVNIYTKQGKTNYWFGTNKNRIYRSTDAGLTWSVSAQMTSTIGAVLGINDIAFTDANNGLATAYFGPTGNGTVTIWNTTDGGATWNMVPTVDPNFGKNDFCNIPGTNIYASCGAGAGNTILSFSSDNGVTWTDWGSSGIQYLYLDFVDPATGWAGSFSDPVAATSGGIFKYNGPLMTNSPFAEFSKAGCGISCTGTYTLTNFSTGSPTPAYTWSVSPAATIANTAAVNPVISFTTGGNYTVTLSATDGTNTSVTSNVIPVTVCAAANANFSVTPNACLNAATNVNNMSTGTPVPNYTWAVTPAAIISNSYAVNPTITFTTNATYTISLTATGGGSTSTTSHTVVAATCVGLHPNTMLDENISLYPNPAHDLITIDVVNVSSFNYQITDILGKVIVSDKVLNNQKATVDVSNIKSGIYFVTVESNNQKSVRKIVVE